MVCEGIKLNLFVGSKIGTFKHVKYDQNSKKKRKDTSRHLQDVKSIQKGEGITCMAFKDREQTEIMLARDNRTMEVYNLLTSQVTQKTDIDFGSGKMHSLSVYEDAIIGAVESGIVKIWKSKLNEGSELNVGENLEKMVHCPYNAAVIATGGKENDLKLWNLERSEVVFQAKNVAHDFLQLRVPVWVSDICFLPDTDGKQMAICSRYGVVRLYDARAQRRPVCSVEFPGQANTCITLGMADKQVLVGTGRGFLQMVDLRGKGRPDKGYKGATGAVTSALVLQKQGLVVSASLDRHLRIHNANTKDLIHKQYMTSKLSCFLVRTASTPLPGDADLEQAVKKEEEVEGNEEEGMANESDPEYDELFQNMEIVREDMGGKKKKQKKAEKKSEPELEDKPVLEVKMSKKKRKKVEEQMEDVIEETKTPKKKKKSKETPTEIVEELVTPKISKKEKQPEASSEEAQLLDESIKQLLRSTEKTKRKLEKQKREKKKKSVFHNC